MIRGVAKTLYTASEAAQALGISLDTLRRWHRRYGDVFTVRFLGFGTGVYVADPAAIRELFTGDQSDLLAGEANSFLKPVLGDNFADGPANILRWENRAHEQTERLRIFGHPASI